MVYKVKETQVQFRHFDSGKLKEKRLLCAVNNILSSADDTDPGGAFLVSTADFRHWKLHCSRRLYMSKNHLLPRQDF